MKAEIRSIKTFNKEKLLADMEYEIEEMAKINYELKSHSHTHLILNEGLGKKDCYEAIMIFVPKGK